jgi:hypothetical protein
VTGLSRLGAVAQRAALRLVPPGRRDWVEALWAEAPEVPAGPRRLAWRAGGVALMAREALMQRRIGSAMLFAAAAALAAWAAWPGSPAGFASSVDRVDVIVLVLVLAGLPLLGRRGFGPPGRSRTARLLRVGGYAAILALIPAKNVIEQVLDAPPRGGTELRLYRLIAGSGFGNSWKSEIVFLVVMALYAAAILWVTAQRSGIAPATLAVGTGAGIAVGAVLYAIVPLGVSNAATNPWLPGSDSDALVALAWILVLLGPVGAGIVAYRRQAARASASQPGSASQPDLGSQPGSAARQSVAAALLTSLVSALLAIAAGSGTIAAMMKAAWLRNWLYHGHLLAGVGGLRLLLRNDPAALAYSHQITAATDAPPFLIMCVAFPLIALGLTGLGVLIARAEAAAGHAGPGHGSGAPLGPGPAPDRAAGAGGSAPALG